MYAVVREVLSIMYVLLLQYIGDGEMAVDRSSYLTSSDSLLVSLITIVISGPTFSSLLAEKSSFTSQYAVK